MGSAVYIRVHWSSKQMPRQNTREKSVNIVQSFLFTVIND